MGVSITAVSTKSISLGGPGRLALSSPGVFLSSPTGKVFQWRHHPKARYHQVTHHYIATYDGSRVLASSVVTAILGPGQPRNAVMFTGIVGGSSAVSSKHF